jgi:hypothetical protein
VFLLVGVCPDKAFTVAAIVLNIIKVSISLYLAASQKPKLNQENLPFGRRT